MNNDLTHGPLPADFVLGLVFLTPDELAAGYRAGFLDAGGAVHVAERLLDQGGALPAWVEETALLLSSDYAHASELIPEPTDHETAAENPLRVWLFLVLADLWSKRDRVVDPLGEVESVYADFDYPDEIEGFVRYLPVPEGIDRGTAAVEARWRSYLDGRAEHYARRRGS